MSFAIGSSVGRYEIISQLGLGGMATVYKAFDVTLQRYVAIKAIKSSLVSEKSVIERMQREARIIANLDNPHIVPVYEFGELDGLPYLVLKFIDGQTLRERMAASKPSMAEINDVVFAVGDALQYAHARRVLHRDIKSSNVLIEKNGNVYLTDFGLARLAEASSALTGDMVIGTPHYMSPEQATNIEQIDEGADIYSFGVMIYELITGRLPFESDDPFELIKMHMNALPPRPTSINSALPDDVDDVVLRALAKDRGDRYADVRELVESFMDAWGEKKTLEVSSSATMDAIGVVAVLITPNGKVYSLVSDSVLMGRDSSRKGIENDIDLSDIDTKKIISRKHAKIERQDDRFVLIDLESRNGTFLNGERVLPSGPRFLEFGDVIQLGKDGIQFTFSK